LAAASTWQPLGGICGSAGAFTVLDDLTAFLRYMLDSPITDRGPLTDIRNAFRELAFSWCCDRDGSP
jgi:hypothetical protein